MIGWRELLRSQQLHNGRVIFVDRTLKGVKDELDHIVNILAAWNDFVLPADEEEIQLALESAVLESEEGKRGLEESTINQSICYCSAPLIFQTMGRVVDVRMESAA